MALHCRGYASRHVKRKTETSNYQKNIHINAFRQKSLLAIMPLGSIETVDG